jgi:hypothetical protein
MVYGGDSAGFRIADPKTGMPMPPTYVQAVPGAFYLRAAAEPWGAAESGDEGARSDARPIYTRQAAAPYLACDDDAPAGSTDCTPFDHRKQPSELFATLGNLSGQLSPDEWLQVSAMCVAGSTALDVQYSLADDSAGHMYGVNVIEEWSEDVTARVPGLGGDDRAVEIDWNFSTWNPYQVVLAKTQLRSSDLR